VCAAPPESVRRHDADLAPADAGGLDESSSAATASEAITAIHTPPSIRTGEVCPSALENLAATEQMDAPASVPSSPATTEDAALSARDSRVWLWLGLAAL